MKRKTTIIVAAGLLSLAAAGGAAYAAKQHWRGGGMFENLTERYDADKNGLVTQEEIDKGRTDNFAKFDADKSGGLSLTEFQALWLEAHRDRMVREFQHFDGNGDANVLLDEYKKPMASLVADMDRNGDKALGRDDRPQGHGRKHKRRHGGGDDMGQHGGGDGMGRHGGMMGEGGDDEPPQQ